MPSSARCWEREVEGDRHEEYTAAAGPISAEGLKGEESDTAARRRGRLGANLGKGDRAQLGSNRPQGALLDRPRSELWIDPRVWQNLWYIDAPEWLQRYQAAALSWRLPRFRLTAQDEHGGPKQRPSNWQDKNVLSTDEHRPKENWRTFEIPRNH